MPTFGSWLANATACCVASLSSARASRSALPKPSPASVAGFSPYHFSRLFTARFGMSVMSYVRDCRLQAAALRLTGDVPPPLTQLAFDCGFESQEAFTRAFRRRYGAPPGQFKREALKQQPLEKPMSTNAQARVEQLEDDISRSERSPIHKGIRGRDSSRWCPHGRVVGSSGLAGLTAVWRRCRRCSGRVSAGSCAPAGGARLAGTRLLKPSPRSRSRRRPRAIRAAFAQYGRAPATHWRRFARDDDVARFAPSPDRCDEEARIR